MKDDKTSRKQTKLSKLEEIVFYNWPKYVISKALLFILWFSIPVTIAVLFNYTPNQLVLLALSLPLFCLFPLFFKLDKQRLKVVKEKPSAYLKTERFEKNLVLTSLITISIWITSLLIFQKLVLTISTTSNWFVPLLLSIGIFSVFIIYASFGFILYLTFYLIETPAFYRVIRSIQALRTGFVPKKDEYVYCPSEIEQANARFIVLSEFLAKKPDKKEINTHFHLFREGLEQYNSYLRTHYGFILRDINHFYSSAKIALHSASNEDTIREGINELSKQMGEHKEPLEVIRTLKHMIKESANFKELCTDLEVDPKRLRKGALKEKMGIAAVVLQLVIIAISQIALNPTFSQTIDPVLQMLKTLLASFI